MFELPQSYYESIVAHAREDAPNECCGILAGDDGRVVKLYRATNIEHSPYRYNVDPKELFHIYREIEERSWDLLGIYHSHTATEAYPSPTDVRLAGWPDAIYLIVSLRDAAPVLRAFRINDGHVTEEELRIVEEAR
ncbi:MAG TPA: M67 family metallopeptidase [Dehalococcoidia bacterium]|nr:M67 family metallopeptidase [Dehalococcoidia bacterium]